MKRGICVIALSVAACTPPAGSENATAPAAEAASYVSEVPTTGWSYESEESAMGDGATRTACVTSENEVRLQWPYENVKADLCLRNSKQFGRDAFVALHGDGQILCRSYETCELRIRYGDGKPRSIRGIGASDGSSNIVFIVDRASLESSIKSADKTAIEMEFYQAGNQAFVFPTKGFDWKS